MHHILRVFRTDGQTFVSTLPANLNFQPIIISGAFKESELLLVK